MCGLEQHHIIFRSQGGLDFPDNIIYFTSEQHKGKEGPHRNRKKDLELKKELQARLQSKLKKNYYTIEELIEILQLKKGQAKQICKKFTYHKEGYDKQEIIRRLMGGKFY